MPPMLAEDIEIITNDLAGASAAPHAPTHASRDRHTNSPPLVEDTTAFKLAKQLRHFQGCTYSEHEEAGRLHGLYHQRPDVHPDCSSFEEVTALLRGNCEGGTPLPNVLGSPKLMKASDILGTNCQAAFEGCSPSATPGMSQPRNLCPSQRHTTSKKNRRPKVTFDIDSLCCFPTSLAFSRRGIKWLPKFHPSQNLTADIHFGLRVSTYTERGMPSSHYTPIHKIPHCCFGYVIGMEPVAIFIFFPQLHQESSFEHSNFLSVEDQQIWYDGILSPCLNQVVGSSNILQHYPASLKVANIDSTAASAEGLGRKYVSREQMLAHDIQPQYLEALWDLVLQTIDENPLFHRFQGATIFMNAKNTKVQYMHSSLPEAFDTWRAHWEAAMDPQFYNSDRTYVDLAKQVTSEDSALPHDHIPEDHEAETYLWRRCCQEAYFKSRKRRNADGSWAKGMPKQTIYPFATLRDSADQTLFSAPNGPETKDGLIYTQFYTLVKTPFDAAKVYVFSNDASENLALDPGYVRSLQQAGGGVTFSKAVCEFGYLHGKRRAHANLKDNQWKSYGVREEHRISLSMMEVIYEQWQQWDLYDDADIDRADSPLPYYIIPTEELFGFLHAQINKYCLLFEHVLAHTAETYSLPETMIMVVALRALRFCYGSNLLARESLLYKDRWETLHGVKRVVKEGLGMQDSIRRCGIGWFLPKINWATWRLAAPYGENVLVGNILVHEEYKRRWRAVQDLRDVYIRFNQAESWYDRYGMDDKPRLRTRWLEYLHVLNIEQFDADIWKTMLGSKSKGELAPNIGEPREQGRLRFCHHDMRKMFSVSGVVRGPHMTTGNKMRFEKVMDLLNFLFLWDDGEERRGWGHKPYRAILQKCFELIERRVGGGTAKDWLDEFLHLVRLTHWMLPYPSNVGLITATKTSRSQGLQRRMMWFSVVYAHPKYVDLPLQSAPSTLSSVIWRARRDGFGNEGQERGWGTSQLISGCRAQGVEVTGHEQERYWVGGRVSIGLKGFAATWERGRPPRLAMLERIQGKSLDELEELMRGLNEEQGGVDEGEVISEGQAAMGAGPRQDDEYSHGGVEGGGLVGRDDDDLVSRLEASVIAAGVVEAFLNYMLGRRHRVSTQYKCVTGKF